MLALGADKRMVTPMLTILGYAEFAAEKPRRNYPREYFSMLASVSQRGAL
ncbi:hypothetical protein RS1P1_07050 [Pseudomonas moraviensis]|jgi:hypothetical protein|nr:hypothetical protein RS1P1_07050 [Pseudomonas moraviensis]